MSGFIDSHAEGHGGHHDLHPVVLEIALRPRPLLGVEAAMIQADTEASPGQHLEGSVRLAAGAGINNEGALLRQQLDQRADFF